MFSLLSSLRSVLADDPKIDAADLFQNQYCIGPKGLQRRE
jgi:hypothetical protein